MCVYDKQVNLVPYLFQEAVGDEALIKVPGEQNNLFALCEWE